MRQRATTALILSGGGARAAYQVGVLRAVARMKAQWEASVDAQASNPTGSHIGSFAMGADRAVSPFGIVVGTSAGAINSAALACKADDFGRAVDELCAVWGGFHAHQVYSTDAWNVLRTGASWLTALSLGWAVARWRRLKPRSLLDNAPLAGLLRELVPMERLPTMLGRRCLSALAVTASCYGTGRHVTFYCSGQPVAPWERPQRRAVQGYLTHDHLLASSAIPFIFPARRLLHDGASTWFGDGSMRQTAPLSPALHLGAERLMVIGAGRALDGPAQNQELPERRYPSLAQVAGHAMASIFLDTLASDVEKLERINRALAQMPDAARNSMPWKPIRCLVISPTQRIDDIAAAHLGDLPNPVRALLAGMGVRRDGSRTQGSALASYLLFEASFTQALMDLGERDAWAKQAEIAEFMEWLPVQPSMAHAVA